MPVILQSYSCRNQGRSLRENSWQEKRFEENICMATEQQVCCKTMWCLGTGCMTWKDSGADVDDDDDGSAYALFLLKLLGLYEKVGWPGLPRSQLFDPRSLQAC